LAKNLPPIDALGLPDSDSSDAEFSVKEFVHATLDVPVSVGTSAWAGTEDEIFAHQERLLSLLEIEIVIGDQQMSVFPSKLNEYLNDDVQFEGPLVVLPPSLRERADMEGLPVIEFDVTSADMQTAFGSVSPQKFGHEDDDDAENPTDFEQVLVAAEKPHDSDE
jgi:hypothetical protein